MPGCEFPCPPACARSTWRWRSRWWPARRCGRRGAFRNDNLVRNTDVTAMDSAQIEARKTRVRTWFETLRDDVCTAFEAVEDALPASAPLGQKPAGHFLRTPWS